MRPPTSESSERKAMEVNLATQPPRNWLDVPPVVMANILKRIGLVEIVENARKVCTTWCEICKDICKDPAMWQVIYVDAPKNERARQTREETCKYILEKSQGQLVDLTVVNSHDKDLLSHVAERTSQLKRLQFACCGGNMCESWNEGVLKKFTLLEELSLFDTSIHISSIEIVGKYCPLLTTLKLNQRPVPYSKSNKLYKKAVISTAIGNSLPGLRHLELIGNYMSNDGLKSILDGCPHLESLDLRGCFYIKLNGALRKRLLQTIKNLKMPKDSLEGYVAVSLFPANIIFFLAFLLKLKSVALR
uniref:putative F-box/LRR-repeat protein 23 n=1 Tax=Erigeron canadensis TaxID=72917 RepID=UPI001CB8CA1B|nr:putative F-box/LRR-repeat protein 23 [Erigeron canadensis]